MAIDLQNRNIPLEPGVYVFKNKRGNIIYIGKAANLRARLSSYKQNASYRSRPMLNEAQSLAWEILGSEIEALIRETELIKKHRPKYNIAMRDDKQYLYVGFTREKYPKIFITHQPSQNQITATYMGPFVDSAALKITLKMLRRIFPYCTCRHPHATLCLNAQIGRCFGFCCSKNQNQKFNIKNQNYKLQTINYKLNIRAIKQILTGKNKRKPLLVSLNKKMVSLSRARRYEEAAKIRDQSRALEHIFAHKHVLKSDLPSERHKALNALAQLLHMPEISRIEGYDISNIHGKHAYGSMVVFVDGVPAKDQYRIFKIRGKELALSPTYPTSSFGRALQEEVFGGNDPAMIREVISRRLQHTEWPCPDVMLIDGGKAQLNAAQAALGNRIAKWQSDCPKIISLAKSARQGGGREEELYISGHKKPLKLKNVSVSLYHLLTHIRDEAHRFALKYYRKAHRKTLF